MAHNFFLVVTRLLAVMDLYNARHFKKRLFRFLASNALQKIGFAIAAGTIGAGYPNQFTDLQAGLQRRCKV